MVEDQGSTVHTHGAGGGSETLRLGVFAQNGIAGAAARGKEIARQLGVGFYEGTVSAEVCDLGVMVGDEISLVPVTGPRELTHGHAVKIDWSGIDVTSGAGRKWDQPILKAVGLKSRAQRLCVVDGTAGLGEDAYVVASFGARVLMLERGAVLAMMLEAHLRRMGEGSETGVRMSVEHADAGAWLTPENIQRAGADVVYLDFMFPAGRKTAERKPMKVLRMLAGGDDDAPAVLAKALASGVRRVVVKRPGKADCVEGPKPTHAIYGKSLRFDVYLRMGIG